MAGSERPPKLKAPLKVALASVAAALGKFGGKGMIIGGVAVIARGVARATRDVDATVAFEGEVETLMTELERHSLVPRIDDAIVFARTRQVLLLRHAPSGVDVDISMAWLPFELEALAASELLKLSGIRVRVARAEDLVIYKSVAWRPQDQQDVERLLTLYGNELDLMRIRRVVGEFAEALDELERAGEVERLIRRVVGD